MALPLFADRVRETSTTTGTGSFTLSGAMATYQTFSSGIGNNSCYYSIVDPVNNAWEVGLGTISGGTTLARTTIIASSNSNSAVSFGSGTKEVACVAPAAFFRMGVPVVRCATVSAGTLSSSFENGDTLDGLTLATGDLILIKDQSSASENGVYKVKASGTPDRVTDFPAGLRVTQVMVWVEHGTVNAGTLWAGIENAAGDGNQVLGTDSASFRCISANPEMVTDSDGATITFNIARSKRHKVVLGGNRTLALSNVKVGDIFYIKLVQDGTGSRTVTWFSTIKWPGGSAPTLTTTINKQDWFIFECVSSGNYDGLTLGKNM